MIVVSHGLFSGGGGDAATAALVGAPAEGAALGVVAGALHGLTLSLSERSLHCDRGDLEGVVLHHEVVVGDEDVLALPLGASDGEATLEEGPGAVLGAEDDEVTWTPLVLVTEAVRVGERGDHAESLGGEFLERFHGPTFTTIVVELCTD